MVFTLDRCKVIALVELAQVDFFGCFGRPQAQGVGGVRAITRHDGVVRHGQHIVRVYPPVLASLANHVSTKAHSVGHLRSRKLPRMTVCEPIVRGFNLLAVLNGLAEHPVFVTNAIAVTRQPQSRHGIKKTRGQATQSPVTQSSIGLKLRQHIERATQLQQGFFDGVAQLQGQQSVVHGTTHQKFHREVIHPFVIALILRTGRVNPTFNQTIAHGVGHSVQPVFGQCGRGHLAHFEEQVVGYGPFDRFKIIARPIKDKVAS